MTNCIVIDDQMDIVELICDVLDIINVDILAKGNNGKDAVELYEKYSPDIVFTDLSMPEYDGLYAVENIKDKNIEAKIIVITGNVNEEDKHILDLLKIPVVIKPFEINALEQAIKGIASTDKVPIVPFEIKYKFKQEYDSYTCIVTYEQYRNFKKLPIIDKCEIVKEKKKNIKSKRDEMQKAIKMAMKNDDSHIRKLSNIATDGGMRY